MGVYALHWLELRYLHILCLAPRSLSLLKSTQEPEGSAPAMLPVKVLFMMVSCDWLAQYSAPPVVRAVLPLNCEFMTVTLAPSA